MEEEILLADNLKITIALTCLIHHKPIVLFTRPKRFSLQTHTRLKFAVYKRLSGLKIRAAVNNFGCQFVNIPVIIFEKQFGVTSGTINSLILN